MRIPPRNPSPTSPFSLGLVLLCCLLLGCQSPNRYVSPRITGRVLDGETLQPIKNAKVRRIKPGGDMDLDSPPKGGEVLAENPDKRTEQDGTFVLESVRTLSLFGKSGWYSVTLSVEHHAYNQWVTNYTLANAEVTPKGEPVVKAGDILLRPRSR